MLGEESTRERAPESSGSWGKFIQVKRKDTTLIVFDILLIQINPVLHFNVYVTLNNIVSTARLSSSSKFLREVMEIY